MFYVWEIPLEVVRPQKPTTWENKKSRGGASPSLNQVQCLLPGPWSAPVTADTVMACAVTSSSWRGWRRTTGGHHTSPSPALSIWTWHAYFLLTHAPSWLWAALDLMATTTGLGRSPGLGLVSLLSPWWSSRKTALDKGIYHCDFHYSTASLCLTFSNFTSTFTLGTNWKAPDG